ncbi:MAG: hypothetical protein U0990_09325 [Candidatus Nanopelagicales bacterium]|nr:hypothetical protein [Candidatus Nanopelagicales bacterium]
MKDYYTLYPGGHWFDDNTMRFFDCRIGASLKTERGNWLFVTSEKGPNGNRRYSVRLMLADSHNVSAGKHVDTLSEFQGYATRSAAIAAMQRESASY